MKSKRTNPFLLAIIISLALAVARSLYNMRGLGFANIFSTPEGIGAFLGMTVASITLIFIPVAVILLIWGAIQKRAAKASR